MPKGHWWSLLHRIKSQGSTTWTISNPGWIAVSSNASLSWFSFWVWLSGFFERVNDFLVERTGKTPCFYSYSCTSSKALNCVNRVMNRFGRKPWVECSPWPSRSASRRRSSVWPCQNLTRMARCGQVSDGTKLQFLNSLFVHSLRQAVEVVREALIVSSLLLFRDRWTLHPGLWLRDVQPRRLVWARDRRMGALGESRITVWIRFSSEFWRILVSVNRFFSSLFSLVFFF
jgi:hypothetical protein